MPQRLLSFLLEQSESGVSDEDKVYFREKQCRKINTLVCWLVTLYALRKSLDIDFKRETKNQDKFKCFELLYTR